jgi:8-oxo-dGTP pyrophosphatase MutT (NUDIX family)
MASRDGNGWVRCSQGHRHWGKFGAAGLLAYAGLTDGASGPGGAGGLGGLGTRKVLLQRRTWWSHHGGTWGLPGGAADSHETPVAAALREAREECLVPAAAVTVRGIFLDDHGGWAYRTVFASAPAPFRVLPGSDETDEAAWFGADEVGQLDLHPGLGAHWAALREGLAPVTVIVDAANVIGSRPDGWWRDRAGAARRLVAALGALAERGVAEFPAELRRPAPAQWFPDILVVLEGQARSALADETAAGRPRLRVVAAPGSGDDMIAKLARETPGQRLVVTADRELRSRCEVAGAQVTGPSWLTGLLDG